MFGENFNRCQVKCDNSEECATHIGLTENSFKDRFHKHRNTKPRPIYTERSKHIKELKKTHMHGTSL